MSDKIESVSKANQSQGLKNEAVEQSKNEKFQQMMDKDASSIQPKFEVLDPKAFANSSMNAQIEHQQTHFNDQDVHSNKMGSATDEEKKDNKQNQSDDSDEIEGIEGVSNNKKTEQTHSFDGSSTVSSSNSTSGVSLEEINKQSQHSIDKIEEAKQQLVLSLIHI